MSSNHKEDIRLLSFDEKIDIIRKIENDDITEEEALNILTVLVEDDNDEIRWTIGETLVVFEPNEVVKKLLIKLSKDKNYLVRTNACDSMCIFSDIDLINWLEQILKKDRSQLVRGYAALSIADISYNIRFKNNSSIALLKQKLNTEKSVWTRINYYSSLFKLGEKQYLQPLLDELNNHSYKNRCAVVNSIADLIDSGLIENTEVVLSTLKEKLLKEESIAVKSSIYKLLETVNGN